MNPVNFHFAYLTNNIPLPHGIRCGPVEVIPVLRSIIIWSTGQCPCPGSAWDTGKINLLCKSSFYAFTMAQTVWEVPLPCPLRELHYGAGAEGLERPTIVGEQLKEITTNALVFRDTLRGLLQYVFINNSN